MTAQMSNAFQRGFRIGQNAQCSDRRRDFAGRRHIEVSDTANFAVSCNRNRLTSVCERAIRHFCAHTLQISGQKSAGLGRFERPVRNAYRSAGNKRGRQERSRIRQIRFNNDALGQTYFSCPFSGSDSIVTAVSIGAFFSIGTVAGINRPRICFRIKINIYSRNSQIFDSHSYMRHAGKFFARMTNNGRSVKS